MSQIPKFQEKPGGRNQSSIVGVHFTVRYRKTQRPLFCWTATWREHEVTMKKTFGVGRLGLEESLRQAIAHRRSVMPVQLIEPHQMDTALAHAQAVMAEHVLL